jgi:hypothetical protein
MQKTHRYFKKTASTFIDANPLYQAYALLSDDEWPRDDDAKYCLLRADLATQVSSSFYQIKHW